MMEWRVRVGQLALPLMLAVAAPLAVIVCIGYLRSVWWTFAIYQLGICLVAPAIESRLAGRSWRQHATMLGLSGPRPADGSDVRDGSPSRPTSAIVLGLVTALVTGAFLVLTRDRFLDPYHLESTLAGWGVSPEQMLTMLAVMAVLNAAAEELFWRGYFPGRVAVGLLASRPPVALTVVLPAFLYASYHAATIGHLVGETSGVVLMTGGVLGAGLLWGWLRQRTGSAWPPLLSHGGAVLGYLAVHLWITNA
jgi:membrane protease YdiL (CAAX protease family)